ncbi:MAG: hypothetical protein IJR90_08080 [Clostridia bacterium]|nr:hypothetical protein [Clostridia bacterium]
MKTVKIKFCNFWSSFDERNNLFYNILKKHLNVELSDDPDFVICSNRGKLFEYMKYDCPRLMFMGESLSPDWGSIDYCVGFDYMDFGDRFFRLAYGFYFDDAKPFLPEKLTTEKAKEIFDSKKYFCNFIYRTASPNGIRDDMFRALSEYKPVVSPGLYMNNVEKGSVKGITYKELNSYLELSKFTIAGESFSFPGIVTEKIVRPFRFHSIPIYYGNPRIEEDFNNKAFIHCPDQESIPKIVEQVKYLDTHDDDYLAMLMESPFYDNEWCVKRYAELEEWLVEVFSQDRDAAYRRARDRAAMVYQKTLKEFADKKHKFKLSDLKECIYNIKKKSIRR